jgi:hypothetical protein
VATDPWGASGFNYGTIWIAPAEPVPAFDPGPEIIVNTIRAGHQMEPAMVVLAGGDYVVVWQTPAANGSDSPGNSTPPTARRSAPSSGSTAIPPKTRNRPLCWRFPAVASS